MRGLSTYYLGLQIKIYKLLVYSSQGPSQEGSSIYLRLSNPVDKDITKITAEAGAIQIENRKEHTISLMLLLTSWMLSLLLKN